MALEQNLKASDAYRNAKQIYSSLGDRRAVLNVNMMLEIISKTLGNQAEAKNLADENSAISHEIGLDTGPKAKLHTELRTGAELAKAGDYAAALVCYQEALEMARKTDHRNTSTEAMILGAMGGAESKLGNLANATKDFDQALSLIRAMGSDGEELLGSELTMRADRMLDQGNLREAKGALQEALKIATKRHDKNQRAFVFASFGDLDFEEDRLEQASRQYEQALAIAAELGNAEEMASIRLDLADVAIEQGDPSKAEIAAREALDLARKDGCLHCERSAERVLADTLLAQGRYPEAAKEIENFKSGREKMGPYKPGFDILLLEARIDTALNRTEEAEKSLNELIATATKTGKLPDAVRARLALGQCEIKAGKTADGHKRLIALENDAKAKGFNLIARKAATAATT